MSSLYCDGKSAFKRLILNHCSLLGRKGNVGLSGTNKVKVRMSTVVEESDKRCLFNSLILLNLLRFLIFWKTMGKLWFEKVQVGEFCTAILGW